MSFLLSFTCQPHFLVLKPYSVHSEGGEAVPVVLEQVRQRSFDVPMHHEGQGDALRRFDARQEDELRRDEQKTRNLRSQSLQFASLKTPETFAADVEPQVREAVLCRQKGGMVRVCSPVNTSTYVIAAFLGICERGMLGM